MTRVFRITQFFSVLSLILFFSSCNKENTIPDVKNSSDKTLIQKGIGNCIADIDDLDISINWSSDCLTAYVTLQLCCKCSGNGTNNCSTSPGLLEIQIENGPFQYWYDDRNVLSQTLFPNTCVGFHFDVPVIEGGEQMYIIQIWFNGQNININPYTGNFC